MSVWSLAFGDFIGGYNAVLIEKPELVRSGDDGRFAEAFRSHRAVAAIDHKRRAGDKRGVVAEEEKRRACDFDGLTHAAEHVVFAPDRVPLRAAAAVEVGGLVGFVRPDPAGVQAVDADVVRGEIEGLTFGQLADGSLRRVVGPAFLLRDMTGDAGDIDDGPAADRFHLREDILGHAGESQRAGGEAAVPVGGGGIQRLGGEGECVVHEVVDAPVNGDGTLDDLAANGFLRHVARDERGVETGVAVGLDRSRGVRVEVAEDDPGAFLGELFDDGTADAGTASGDDGHFAGEAVLDGVVGWDGVAHGGVCCCLDPVEAFGVVVKNFLLRGTVEVGEQLPGRLKPAPPRGGTQRVRPVTPPDEALRPENFDDRIGERTQVVDGPVFEVGIANQVRELARVWARRGEGAKVILPWLELTLRDLRRAEMVEDEARIGTGLDQFDHVGKIPWPDGQLAMQSDLAEDLHSADKARAGTEVDVLLEFNDAAHALHAGIGGDGPQSLADGLAVFERCPRDDGLEPWIAVGQRLHPGQLVSVLVWATFALDKDHGFDGGVTARFVVVGEKIRAVDGWDVGQPGVIQPVDIPEVDVGVDDFHGSLVLGEQVVRVAEECEGEKEDGDADQHQRPRTGARALPFPADCSGGVPSED